jgi:transposase
MIQVTSHMRVFVAVEPADFRCGIDGLARVCKTVLQGDPMSGSLFVFRNRRATSVKILAYDGQGFWLCQKRMSESRFRHWPDGSGPATSLEAHQLHVLLSGGDPEHAQGAPKWRPVTVSA